MRSVVNLIQNGRSSAVIIPQTKLRELRWKRGDHLAVFIERGMLIVANLESDIDRVRARAAETATGVDLAEPARP